MSMSKTVGATVRPLAKDVPVTPTLMNPCFLWRHPPWPSGDPCNWYCHRAWTSGCQHGPADALQGTGAGSAPGAGAFAEALAAPPANALISAPTASVTARRPETRLERSRRVRSTKNPTVHSIPRNPTRTSLPLGGVARHVPVRYIRHGQSSERGSHVTSERGASAQRVRGLREGRPGHAPRPVHGRHRVAFAGPEPAGR